MIDKPLMFIRWLDSTGNSNGWVEEKEAASWVPSDVFSTGWVIGESNVSITIAGHMDTTNKHCDGVFCIPKVAIVSSCRIDLARIQDEETVG